MVIGRIAAFIDKFAKEELFPPRGGAFGRIVPLLRTLATPTLHYRMRSKIGRATGFLPCFVANSRLNEMLLSNKSNVEKGSKMRAKIKVIFRMMGATGVMGAVSLALSLNAFASIPSASEVLKKYDLDRDGTVTIQEITKSAEAQFEALDGDHDGTLDKNEYAKAKMSPADDPDNDGTIDKTEYMNALKKRFAAADKKHDGKLGTKELNSKEGHSLRLMLQ
jgi:Ca2+-binding EF-hand superfamily protein